MTRFKELSDQLINLVAWRDRHQRQVDNVNQFLSEAGVKHAKAQLAVVKRNIEVTTRELLGELP